MSGQFDVVVIGGGPGGYIAAIRAAQLGLATACIDDGVTPGGKAAPGGTCTNVGCIPSKALLQSSENYEQAGHGFAEHGIEVKGLALDLARMLARKDKVVRQNNEGILYLFRKNRIAFFNGRGAFEGGAENGWRVKVTVAGTEPQTLTARHVVVATGSSPRALSVGGAAVPFDNRLVLDNAGALAMPAVPKRLGVIGAGVIGLEMGSVWRRLGAEVTMLEMLDVFLPGADEAVANEAWKIFTRGQGLAIVLGAEVREVTQAGGGIAVEYAAQGAAARRVEFDRLIVSIGRVPNTAGLAAETVGLELDARGAIEVDAECRTNLPGVWAIGDVVRGPMLAHKAEEEGVAVAERIAGGHGHVDFNTIPWVIYTAPEIAWVGCTEQQLKRDGVDYRCGQFAFAANGRARALGDTRGFVKILADAATDRVLGVHVIGPMASELVAEAVVAMEFHAAAEDIALICHAHPTLSEAMKEAALAVGKRGLNA
ncbi:MAG: dihydrolipoyl dehydrogenase [Burkholderiales bacterium]|nr:dihydrolipoyl dehydrogenase [Burkholderiales bacterium]